VCLQKETVPKFPNLLARFVSALRGKKLKHLFWLMSPWATQHCVRGYVLPANYGFSELALHWCDVQVDLFACNSTAEHCYYGLQYSLILHGTRTTSCEQCCKQASIMFIIISIITYVCKMCAEWRLLSLISDFRHDVDEIRATLGYYAASCGTTWRRVIFLKSAIFKVLAAVFSWFTRILSVVVILKRNKLNYVPRCLSFPGGSGMTVLYR
jgi:hypothetical protein